VSVADLASQALITLTLREYFPEDPIVGEEEAKTIQQHKHLGNNILELIQKETNALNLETLLEIVDYGSKSFDSNKRFWTVDPIDGTKGFLRGEQFAVALALLEQGQVVLGVLGCPNMTINNTELPTWSIIICGQRSRNIHNALKWSKPLKKFSWIQSPRSAWPVFVNPWKKNMPHTTSTKNCRCSRYYSSPMPDGQSGQICRAGPWRCLYLSPTPREKDYREKIWDHAAGSIIVEEAGGKVTDFKGNPLQFNLGKKLENNIGILATNTHLHTQVLDAIAGVI
jgi:3'-phosphoadenosine 5'-phosphosulfate (PAPS) 3'-phosphatase